LGTISDTLGDADQTLETISDILEDADQTLEMIPIVLAKAKPMSGKASAIPWAGSYGLKITSHAQHVIRQI
jgi:hypothetical protein